MKIIIETSPDLDNAKKIVFKQFTEKLCKEGFKDFKITIEDEN